LDNKEDIASLVSKSIDDGFNKKIWGKKQESYLDLTPAKGSPIKL